MWQYVNKLPQAAKEECLAVSKGQEYVREEEREGWPASQTHRSTGNPQNCRARDAVALPEQCEALDWQRER